VDNPLGLSQKGGDSPCCVGERIEAVEDPVIQCHRDAGMSRVNLGDDRFGKRISSDEGPRREVGPLITKAICDVRS
jgi:hypothetical protein